MKNNRRLTAQELEADRDVITALEALSDYAPRTAAHSIATLLKLIEEVDEAHEEEQRTEHALVVIRNRILAKEQQMHGGVRGAKDQVVAQYGADSDEVLAIGRKKRSDYKRPVRRAKTATK